MATNKQFFIEFIEEYRKCPCLWRNESKEYRDRAKKNKAYEKLLMKLKEVNPDATIQTLKNKIDSMRGSFRKELRKMKDSKRSGACGEDVYEPHLWYFRHLAFLMDQGKPRENKFSIDLTESNTMESQRARSASPTGREDGDQAEGLLPDIYYLSDSSIATNNENSESPSRAPSSKPNINQPKADKYDDILEKISKRFDLEKEDKYTVIGKNFANKLRELPKETGIVTEKMINDILFEAQMGNITKNSRAIIQDIHTNQIYA